MKSQVLDTLSCYISGEAAGENWGSERSARSINLLLVRPRFAVARTRTTITPTHATSRAISFWIYRWRVCSFDRRIPCYWNVRALSGVMHALRHGNRACERLNALLRSAVHWLAYCLAKKGRVFWLTWEMLNLFHALSCTIFPLVEYPFSFAFPFFSLFSSSFLFSPPPLLLLHHLLLLPLCLVCFVLFPIIPSPSDFRSSSSVSSHYGAENERVIQPTIS